MLLARKRVYRVFVKVPLYLRPYTLWKMKMKFKILAVLLMVFGFASIYYSDVGLFRLGRITATVRSLAYLLQ